MRSLQVFRTPVGGLFRHVRDLVRGLAALGHDVGIVCDSTTGGPAADAALAGMAQACSLGIHRLPIGRLPGLADAGAASAIARIAASVKPDLLHGHGAKGGVYARLAGSRLKIPSLYTPHGGSLHYDWSNPRGAVFLAAERLLLRRRAGLLFVCDYERSVFEKKIGFGGLPFRVVYNGLWPEEFSNVPLAAEARDLIFLGELRELKGIRDLLEALAQLTAWRPVSATLVGDGSDRPAFEALVQRLNLTDRVRFAGALPARQAFGLERLMVMPSRAESLPYVILEAVAAAKPLIATRVGGESRKYCRKRHWCLLQRLRPWQNPSGTPSATKSEAWRRLRPWRLPPKRDFRHRLCAKTSPLSMKRFSPVKGSLSPFLHFG